MIHRMARKSYTDEFRRQAVVLHESTPGATLRGIADDLGNFRDTLADWVKALGSGSTTAPISSRRTPTGRPETASEKIARLEAERTPSCGGPTAGDGGDHQGAEQGGERASAATEEAGASNHGCRESRLRSMSLSPLLRLAEASRRRQDASHGGQRLHSENALQ